MKILRVKHTNLYDVFVGEGWENHARVYHKAGKLSFVGKNNHKLSHEQVVILAIKLALLEKS